MIVEKAIDLPELPSIGDIVLVHQQGNVQLVPPRVAFVTGYEVETNVAHSNMQVQLDGVTTPLPWDYAWSGYAFEVMP